MKIKILILILFFSVASIAHDSVLKFSPIMQNDENEGTARAIRTESFILTNTGAVFVLVKKIYSTNTAFKTNPSSNFVMNAKAKRSVNVTFSPLLPLKYDARVIVDYVIGNTKTVYHDTIQVSGEGVLR